MQNPDQLALIEIVTSLRSGHCKKAVLPIEDNILRTPWA